MSDFSNNQPFGEGRVPPYNRNAEISVLGSILLDNACIDSIEGFLQPESFYIDANKRIYNAMLVLRKKNEPIDHVTLGNILRESGDLEKVGGAIALSGLTDSVATSANVDSHARIVREAHAVRMVLFAAQELVSVGYSQAPIIEIAEHVEKISEASTRLLSSRMPTSMFDLGSGVLNMYQKVAGGYRGVPLPWPTLDNMTAGMWPKTITIFVARPGTGKCLKSDTPVLDPTDGVYRSICDVVRDGRAVLSRFEDGTTRTVLPDAFLYTGRKECLSLDLSSGRSLSGTPEHPVMTVDGWKRLDEISVGDYVETVRCVPEPLLPEIPPDEEVVLLAALLADDGYTSDCISFTNQDRAILSIVSRSCEKYGAELRKSKGMRRCDWKICWKGNWRGRGPNPVRVLLDKYGCGHSLSKNKEIPERVFSFSNEKLALFLGVFWGCDGYVDPGDTGITLASEQMVRQIQRLLLRFGVLSSVAYKAARFDGRVFDSWRLRVYSSTLESFRNNIDPVVERKQRALDKLKRSNPNVDNVPMTPDLATRLKAYVSDVPAKERATSYRAMESALGMTTSFSVSHLYRRRTVSRRTFEAFVDAFGCEEFRPMLKNHWDRVENVTDDGEQDVYDLTVDGTHSFVANDIVVHNTFVAVISARHAWLNDIPTLVISPEMSKEEIAERFFTIDSGVSYRDFVQGKISDFVYPKLIQSVEGGEQRDGLWIMDADDDISPMGIEEKIRACKPKFLAIDSMYDLKIKGERRDRVILALEWAKKAAKKFDLAVAGFAQQNRVAELAEKNGGGSRLGTIGLADELGQDPHAVFALEQDKDMKADKIMKIIPLKLRRGEKTKEYVLSDWDFDKMKYFEIEEEDEEYVDVENDF